jgi:uncharacterized protein (DUF362 family)
MSDLTRRTFFGAAWAGPLAAQSPQAAPEARVAVAKCLDYDASLMPAMNRMFDQLGGLGKLVAGKTVGVKVNMTGSPRDRVGLTPAEDAQYTHPAVVGAAMALIGKAGARRIRVLEGAFGCGDPLAEFMLDAGWEPNHLLSAAKNVEIENTNVLGQWKAYKRMMCPKGGYIFNGFDLSPAYEQIDVMVSIAKLKEHATCGVTLTMKNMFGITPITIYGDHAGKNEPATQARGGRGTIMHLGMRQPSASALAENDPKTPRSGEYRMPRIVVDVCAARPIHLAIIDGVASMCGGEGPWNGPQVRAIRPGVLVAGLNPVSTDAVGTALMGFDPLAEKGTEPFERCDSTLALAAAKGLGTHDLRRIEIVGGRVEELKFDFRGSWGPGWRPPGFRRRSSTGA